MILASECAQHCTFVRDYLGLMSDWPHICFEITLTLIQDVLIGVLLWPLIKRWARRYRTRLHQEIDAEHGIIHTESDQ